MENHFVGKGQNSSDIPASTSGGTSLVVRQFMEILRGEVELHAPQNEFMTVAVEADEHYCLKCFSTGMRDVWIGTHDGLNFKLGRCRCCGAEVTL